MSKPSDLRRLPREVNYTGGNLRSPLQNFMNDNLQIFHKTNPGKRFWVDEWRFKWVGRRGLARKNYYIKLLSFQCGNSHPHWMGILNRKLSRGCLSPWICARTESCGIISKGSYWRDSAIHMTRFSPQEKAVTVIHASRKNTKLWLIRHSFSHNNLTTAFLFLVIA